MVKILDYEDVKINYKNLWYILFKCSFVSILSFIYDFLFFVFIFVYVIL